MFIASRHPQRYPCVRCPLGTPCALYHNLLKPCFTWPWIGRHSPSTPSPRTIFISSPFSAKSTCSSCTRPPPTRCGAGWCSRCFGTSPSFTPSNTEPSGDNPATRCSSSRVPRAHWNFGFCSWFPTFLRSGVASKLPARIMSPLKQVIWWTSFSLTWFHHSSESSLTESCWATAIDPTSSKFPSSNDDTESPRLRGRLCWLIRKNRTLWILFCHFQGYETIVSRHETCNTWPFFSNR